MNRHHIEYGLPFYEASADLPDCLIPNHIDSGVVTSLDELKRRAKLAEKHLGSDALMTRDAWARVRLVESGQAALEEVVVTKSYIRWKKHIKIYRATDGLIPEATSPAKESQERREVAEAPAASAADSLGNEAFGHRPVQAPAGIKAYLVKKGNELKGLTLELREFYQAGASAQIFDQLYDFACAQLGVSKCRAEAEGNWLCFVA